MKKLIFSIAIVFITCLYTIANTQISGLYYSDFCEYTNNYSLKLYSEIELKLLENGTYNLNIVSLVTDANISLQTISYGNYILTNNKLTLTDSLHNFEIVGEVINGNILIKKAYSELVGIQLELYDENPELYDKAFFPKMDKNKNQIEIEHFLNSNKVLNNFDETIYFSSDYSIQIEFLKNNFYILKYRNCKISEGYWSRNHNLLSLYDTCLKAKFNFLIEKDFLSSKVFPFSSNKLKLYEK